MTETRAKKEGEGKEYTKRGRKKRNTCFVLYDLYVIRDKENMKSKPAFKAFGKYFFYERSSATIQKGEEFPKQFIRKRILRKHVK